MLCEEYLLDDAEIVIVAYGVVARIAQGGGGQGQRRRHPGRA